MSSNDKNINYATCSPEVRQEERGRIAKATEAFLKAGGKITELEQHEGKTSKLSDDWLRGMCRRWEKSFNHKRIDSARRKLKRVSVECLVSAEVVSELTGVKVESINSWLNKPKTEHLLTQPYQLSSLRFRLVDVISWIDWVMEKAK